MSDADSRRYGVTGVSLLVHLGKHQYSAISLPSFENSARLFQIFPMAPSDPYPATSELAPSTQHKYSTLRIVGHFHCGVEMRLRPVQSGDCAAIMPIRRILNIPEGDANLPIRPDRLSVRDAWPSS